jgi:D-amino-acid dehydrogenase
VRIVVLGAGVVGVTTAWYLAADGHQVVVIDRQPRVAAETSFANAGLIAPGHAYAWASPRAPRMLLRSLWRDDTALKLRLRADPALWRWACSFLGNCRTERNRRNTLIKLRLCLWSQKLLDELTEAEALDYHRIARGLLYLYRNPVHLEAGRRNMALLNENGMQLRAIDANECRAIEPALADARVALAGAIYAPGDASGDCRLFTEQLAERAARRGVEFRFGRTVTRLHVERGRIAAIATDAGDMDADLYVLALGSYAAPLARTAGLRLPVYPVKGYSLTLPLRDNARAPSIGGVDEHNLVAYARFGDRMRLTGTADIAGYDRTHRPSDFAAMLAAARGLFPDAAHYDKPDYWTCLRPMTPDGPPLLGPTPIDNLLLNAGSGHMGWTMACANARIVADLIARRAPPIPLEGLLLEDR